MSAIRVAVKMVRRSFTVIAATSLAAIAPGIAAAQPAGAGAARAVFDVDMTGVDLFWRVTDVLARNEEPDSALWHALFTSPGYAALHNDKQIRSNIELAFRPSNALKLDSTLAATNYWRRRDLQHLIKVRSNTAALRLYQNQVNIDDAIRQGIREASIFLPPGAEHGSPPPIRFVIFSPDARVMGGNIIFDLAFTRDLSFNLLSKTMGHEFHHFLIGGVSEFSLPEPTSPLYGLARAIRQLQVEGVADLIDKEALDAARAADADWQEQWRVPFATTSARLARFDTLLVELMGDSTRLVQYGKVALNELFPMGGHPNGNAMARLIVQHIGRNAIIESLGSPFEFFRLYDRAARLSGTGHVFSGGAMDYLAQLEQRLGRRKPNS